MKAHFTIGVLAIALTGCAGMDLAECTAADWQMIGFEDGTEGRSQSSIGKYRKACAEHGIAPDLALYKQGYSEGIRTFCRESNGFKHGRTGGAYGGVCPDQMEADFLAGYSLGREHYQLSREVHSLRSRIDNSSDRIRSLEDSIASKTLKVASDDTSGDERLQLMLDIKNHTFEINELKNTIREYQVELSYKEAEYAALERPAYY